MAYNCFKMRRTTKEGESTAKMARKDHLAWTLAVGGLIAILSSVGLGASSRELMPAGIFFLLGAAMIVWATVGMPVQQ